MIGDTPIRFKQRPTQTVLSDVPTTRPKNSTNQQAFSNRYDFGASLSAAIQTPKAPSPRQEAPTLKMPQPPKIGQNGVKADGQSADASLSKPSAISVEKPPLQSSSYHELLDKYCFVRSKPTDQKKGGAAVAS